LNQDGKDGRKDQDHGMNQDGKDGRKDQDHGMNQDGMDERKDQDHNNFLIVQILHYTFRIGSILR